MTPITRWNRKEGVTNRLERISCFSLTSALCGTTLRKTDFPDRCRRQESVRAKRKGAKMAGKWLWVCRLGTVLGIASAPSRAETLYVDSERGRDAHSGRREQPIRTLARAAQIVNDVREPGPTTIRLAPGVYCVTETVAFENSREYTTSNRLVIEGTILPDANNWTPALMPVVISTVQGQGPDTERHAIALKIEVSHATVRGIKFLGNPRPNTWAYSVFRPRKDLTEDDLKAIRCPVLISHGDRDTFVQLADVVWMYKQIKNADLSVAPAGGHGHHTDQVDAFGPILLRFLARAGAVQ